MNLHRTILLFCISLILVACEKPIKVYQIDSDVEHKMLKLYKDSSFNEISVEIEDEYQYSGIWTGNIIEGDTLTFYRLRSGGTFITTSPNFKYRVTNDKLIQIN